MIESAQTMQFTLCNGKRGSKSLQKIEFEDNYSNALMLASSRAYAVAEDCSCHLFERFPSKPKCPWLHCRRSNCASSRCRKYYGRTDRSIAKVDFCQLNLCMMQNGRALTCGVSSELMFHWINRLGRIYKKSIPSEVAQLIVMYVHCAARQVRSWSPSGDDNHQRSRPIPGLVGKDVWKMLTVRLKSGCQISWKCHWFTYNEYHYLYLESNGTLWEESKTTISWQESRTAFLQVNPYFLKNKILIKDIALGKGIKRKPYRYNHQSSAHCLAVDFEGRVFSWGYQDCNHFGQCARRGDQFRSTECPSEITFPSSKYFEKQRRCTSIQCGVFTSYVCLKVSAVDDLGNELHFDRHFLFGDNRKNQCFTFDGRQKVETPFCINEIVETRFGGQIESVCLDGEKTHVVVVKRTR